MTSREEGKDARRKIILNAARELIGGEGETGFTMRALSDRAGFSITTPYNLFGSKQAIMQTILDEDLRQFSEALHRKSRNQLQLIFDAVTDGVAAFAEDPSYYQAVMAAVYREGGKQYRSAFRGPRRQFWQDLVRDAIGAGYLSKKVDADAFSLNLAAIFFCHILEWVAEEMDLETVEARTHYGFALALLAMAEEPHQALLKRKVVSAQKRITQISKPALATRPPPRARAARGGRRH